MDKLEKSKKDGSTRMHTYGDKSILFPKHNSSHATCAEGSVDTVAE